MYEIAVGEDTFRSESDPTKPFDSWAPRTDEEEDEEDEEIEEPFEKIKVKDDARIAEYPNELVLERWVPWSRRTAKHDASDDSKSSKNPKVSKGGSGSKASKGATDDARRAGADVGKGSP